MNIGMRIKQRREELNLTQEELALKMGYKSKSSINKIEKGKNDISQTKVVRFAEVLDTTIEYLMGWDIEKVDYISKEHEESLKDLSSFDEIPKNKNIRMFIDHFEGSDFSEKEIERLIAYANLIIAERK